MQFSIYECFTRCNGFPCTLQFLENTIEKCYHWKIYLMLGYTFLRSKYRNIKYFVIRRNDCYKTDSAVVLAVLLIIV